VVFEDRTATNETLMLITSKEEISEASILDNNGKVLASWHHPKDGPLHIMEQIVAHWALPKPVVLPIIHENKLVCEVCLNGNGGSLLRFLLRGIVRSLDDIASVAHEVRCDRTFGLRVPSATIAELHELSSDFNGLLDEMEAWQTHLKQENDSLTHLAMHDSLTGMPNRALGNIKPAEKLAVLFINGDRFKELNDSYSHAAGDPVLTTIAGRIRAQLRENDLVARLAGDEFAMLLAPINNTEDVLQIADNIIDCMTRLVILQSDERVMTSLSIGIALYPDNAMTPQGLLHEVDDAMYQAKHHFNGNNGG